MFKIKIHFRLVIGFQADNLIADFMSLVPYLILKFEECKKCQHCVQYMTPYLITLIHFKINSALLLTLKNMQSSLSEHFNKKL